MKLLERIAKAILKRDYYVLSKNEYGGNWIDVPHAGRSDVTFYSPSTISYSLRGAEFEVVRKGTAKVTRFSEQKTLYKNF